MAQHPENLEMMSDSLRSGTPIAYGATADVHTYASGWILKLFHPRYDAAYAEREARTAREVWRLTRREDAFSVPEVGEQVSFEGRHGLVYAFAKGCTLQAECEASGFRQIEDYAKLLARLHARIHACEISSEAMALPSQSQQLRHAIGGAPDLNPEQRNQALAKLEVLGNGQKRLCHGDFHMNNVLADQGRHVIIDWHDASLGDPLADVARTSLLIRYGSSPKASHPEAPAGMSKEAYTALRTRFNACYLDHHRLCHPLPDWHSRLQEWEYVVAAARLNEQISPWERGALIELVATKASPQP